jgi:hypothetical protein
LRERGSGREDEGAQRADGSSPRHRCHRFHR